GHVRELPSLPTRRSSDLDHPVHTYVYYQGRFHSAAAVVVMVNTWLDFEVFTTHNLQAKAEKLVVTAADNDRRTVLELNAEPAAQDRKSTRLNSSHVKSSY